MNNRDLLYSTRNYIQYRIITYNGKESVKEYTHTHIYMVARSVKNLPAMQENWVESLCWEDPLVLKTHESPLDSKEIKPVNPKGNQS